MLRNQQPQYIIPIDGEWVIVKDDYIEQFVDNDEPTYNTLDEHIYNYQINPLAFTLPHGKPSRSNDRNDGMRFINDWKNDLTLLTAGNQNGKTFLAGVKQALYIVPTEPDWPCYTEHGVKYKPWTGPKIAIAASYSWDNVQTLWDTYRKIFPRHELGQYAPNWGAFKDEQGRAKELQLTGQNPSKRIKLACGSEIVFLCYTQSITHWESRQCDCAHIDEQIPEELYDALTARQTTRGNYTPIWMSLTPHKIEGRPDTGGEGWIVQKLLKGSSIKGRKFEHYTIRTDDVPEAFITKEKKKQLYQQYIVEPQEIQDLKRIREGRSRYYGEPEYGGGLVLASFHEAIHIIPDNTEIAKYKPTYFRMIDHGENPCASLIIALMPWGDAIVIDEYYEFGNTMAVNALRIVESLSKNTRTKITEFEYDGRTFPIYEEVVKGKDIFSSELDRNSFGSKAQESGRTIGRLYNDYGCRCIPANGSKRKMTVPLLKDWLALDKNRGHILGRIKGKAIEEAINFGSPRLYIMSHCTNLINEIKTWTVDDKTGKEKDKDDHLISCLLFFAAQERYYMGDWNIEDQESLDSTDSRETTNYTGY